MNKKQVALGVPGKNCSFHYNTWSTTHEIDPRWFALFKMKKSLVFLCLVVAAMLFIGYQKVEAFSAHPNGFRRELFTKLEVGFHNSFIFFEIVYKSFANNKLTSNINPKNSLQNSQNN